MAKLWQFSQGHPKPAFSEKVQRGEQGKFFTNRPKSSHRFKGPKALWRICHYPLFSMHLKCKDWRQFFAQKADPKVPEWLKKCKWGTKANLSKIAQKVALV